MKIASFLAFSVLLLSIQAIKYFKGNDIYSSSLSNPSISATPFRDNGDQFNPDSGNTVYLDNNKYANTNYLPYSSNGADLGNAGVDNFFTNDYNDVNPNIGRMVPANGVDSYYGSGQLYPNLYSLTLGAQNYGNSGLNQAYNFDGAGGQFGVDSTGGDLNTNQYNSGGSNLTPQGSYGANLYPTLMNYADVGGDNGDYAPNFDTAASGQFYIN